MAALLECMRTATDHRSKKFTARFFHYLRSVHALEEQLKVKDAEFKDDELAIEKVLQKHAGSVSAISWLFW